MYLQHQDYTKMTTPNDHTDVPLQEDNATVSVADDQSTEVVKFQSIAPSMDAPMHPSPFPKNVSSCPTDANLGDFLNRPVLINSITWSPELLSFNGTFDPWTLWMNITSVRNKLQNYHYYRGNLHLRFQMNGTNFHYGRLMFSYEPCFGHSVSPSTGLEPWKSHSTLPHVIMDPSTNVEGRMELPFLTPHTWIDLGVNAAQWLGVVHYDTLAALTYSSGVLATGLEVQVYAWIEDLELAYPSSQALAVYSQQSSKSKPKTRGKKKSEMDNENANQGLISRPANTVAEIASYLSYVPVIGPFAKATEIGAGALAHIAGMFGYSRPRILDPPTRIFSTSAPIMSATDVADNSIPFGVGAKSELTIDPMVNGEATDADQLTIQAIAGKWCLLERTIWNAGDAIDTILIGDYVQPYLGTATSGIDVQHTPMSFLGRVFRYWRGSIEIKVQIVCSRFHRGRLRFAWSPDGNLVTASETNLNYGQIIDIDQTTTFVFKIPYARDRGYLYTGDGASAYVPEQHNGVFYISVQNPLTNPEAVKDVTVLTWVRAGPDFEFAGPTDVNVRTLGLAVYQSSTMKPAERQDMGIEPDVNEVALWDSVTHPETNSVFIGDPVRSLRPLLKRYSKVADIVWNPNNSVDSNFGAQFAIGFPYYPPFAGKTTPSLGSYTTAAGFDQSASRVCMMTYFNYMFVGKKGSVRWDITNPIHGPVSSSAPTCVNINLRRRFGNQDVFELERNVPYFTQAYSEYGFTNAATTTLFLNYKDRDYFAGFQNFPVTDTDINVEIPPYNPCRFYQADSSNLGGQQTYGLNPDGFMVLTYQFVNRGATALGVNGLTSTFSCAAGEDFQYVGWRGIPPTKFIDTAPVLTSQVMATIADMA